MKLLWMRENRLSGGRSNVICITSTDCIIVYLFKRGESNVDRMRIIEMHSLRSVSGNIKRLEIAPERIPNILFIPVIGHSVDRVGRCGDGRQCRCHICCNYKQLLMCNNILNLSTASSEIYYRVRNKFIVLKSSKYKIKKKKINK